MEQSKYHPYWHNKIAEFFGRESTWEAVHPVSFFEGGCLLAANVIQAFAGGEICMSGRQVDGTAIDHAVVRFTDEKGTWIADADGVFSEEHYPDVYRQRELSEMGEIQTHDPDKLPIAELSGDQDKGLHLYPHHFTTLRARLQSYLANTTQKPTNPPQILVEAKPLAITDEIDFKSESNPLYLLGLAVAKACGELNELKELYFAQPATIAQYYSLPDKPQKDISINCYFSDNPYLFDHETLGFFSVTSGPFEEIDEDHLAKEFRVFVYVSENMLIQEWQENGDYYPDTRALLEAWAVTITHELCHAVEFIRHGHGIPPADVDSLDYAHETPDGELDCMDAEDISTGGMLYENLDGDDDLDTCEQRVESIGAQWLHAVLKDPSVKAALENCEKHFDRKLNNHFGCYTI